MSVVHCDWAAASACRLTCQQPCAAIAAGGRLLLRVPLTPERQSERSRKRRRHEKVQPGSVVEGTVVKAHPLHLDVQLADGGEYHYRRLAAYIAGVISV